MPNGGADVGNDLLTEPPIKLKTLLKMAWGMTLGLSNDQAQQHLGDLFTETFKDLVKQRPEDLNATKYLNAINGSLSSFLRSMGYEKDFLVVELDTQKKIQEKEIENVNELADMTSLSSDGLITRTVAFFIGGAGSVLAVWQSLFQSEESASSLTNGTLNEIVTKVNNITITNQSTTEISGQVPSVPANLPNEIAIFLLGGSVAFIVFVIAMKMVKGWWIKNRILSKTIKEQQEHWESHVRPEFIRLLKAFFYDVKQITSEYFNEYREDIMAWDDNRLTTYIRTILPREKLYIHNAEELKDLEMIRKGTV